MGAELCVEELFGGVWRDRGIRIRGNVNLFCSDGVLSVIILL